MIFLKQARLMKRSSWGVALSLQCGNSLFVGFCFFSLACVIFPPHIRPYTHAHTLPGFRLFFSDKMISARILGMVPSTLGTTPKSTLKMSSKEEHLPCLRLVAKVATNPTPEQEFYGSSISMEQSYAHNIASLLAKAKATKQAKIQKPLKLGSNALRAQKTHSRPKSQWSSTIWTNGD